MLARTLILMNAHQLVDQLTALAARIAGPKVSCKHLPLFCVQLELLLWILHKVSCVRLTDISWHSGYCYLVVFKHLPGFYRPRSRGDNAIGSVRVCRSVCL